jgi:hypothetical protein
MVFIVFLVLGLISVIAALVFKNKVAMLGSLAFLVLSVVIPTVIYSTNIGTIADLQAFYTTSAENFQIARDDTASYLSEDKVRENIALIPIYGSIERMGMGQSTADRVLEYRNAVNAYNSSFARYKAYKDNILYGMAYPGYSTQMRLLVMNKSVATQETTQAPTPTTPSGSLTQQQMSQLLNEVLKNLNK